MELDKEALDRYITGNYGDDQFTGVFVLWLHCSPEMITKGLDCAATQRRDCQCTPAGSHDHALLAITESERELVEHRNCSPRICRDPAKFSSCPERSHV